VNISEGNPRDGVLQDNVLIDIRCGGGSTYVRHLKIKLFGGDNEVQLGFDYGLIW